MPMVKIENLFSELQKNVEFLEKKIEQYEGDLTASKAEYEKPFAYEQELKEKLNRQCELNAQLDLENAQVQDADLCESEDSRNEDITDDTISDSQELSNEEPEIIESVITEQPERVLFDPIPVTEPVGRMEVAEGTYAYRPQDRML